MTMNELIDKGYKEFKPSSLYNAQRACQKCVYDSNGSILYYISVFMYHDNHQDGDMYEVQIQLYQKDTHFPLNLNFFGGWSIDDVEKYVDFIYYMGVKQYFDPKEIDP